MTTNMKTLYFIKDTRGNEFYWRYRIDEGFTKEIKEATSFESGQKHSANIEHPTSPPSPSPCYMKCRLI